MPHVIVSPCVGTKDQACTEVCPVECIYDGGEMFLIHPDECIDCGACVPACPVSAIYPEEDVPAGETEYIQKNRVFFGL
ncbi:ferredoxin family protein [Deinococcus radiomollis]|uniref:ferredoxin n=1 Tax=Deinococcus TaxID=1298 RepID=UPI0038928753